MVCNHRNLKGIETYVLYKLSGCFICVDPDYIGEFERGQEIKTKSFSFIKEIPILELDGELIAKKLVGKLVKMEKMELEGGAIQIGTLGYYHNKEDQYVFCVNGYESSFSDIKMFYSKNNKWLSVTFENINKLKSK